MNQLLHPLQMNRHERRKAKSLSRKFGPNSRQQLTPDLQELGPEIERAGQLVVGVLEGRISPADAVALAHPQIKGMLPKLLKDHYATPDQVREALQPAWHNFSVRVANIEKRQDVLDLFRYAQFEIPDWISDTVTVWRGTVGLSLEQARRGYSWTLHKGVACAFALEHWQPHGLGGRPLVLRREARKQDLVYFAAKTYEGSDVVFSEVIIDAHPAGEIDGTEEEWQQIKTPLPRAPLPAD